MDPATANPMSGYHNNNLHSVRCLTRVAAGATKVVVAADSGGKLGRSRMVASRISRPQPLQARPLEVLARWRIASA